MFFVVIFLQINLNAQIYVAPANYVFANNKIVYKEHKLEVNAANSDFF